MDKIKNLIKRYDIDVIVLIIFIVSGASFLVYLNCGDELWNFANCYKMSIGYKIYEDINVIITPLFFYIAQIFFKIFGNTIFSFRIYNVLIYLAMFFLVYKIFEKLKIVRRRRIFYTTILMLTFNEMIAAGANYNILVMIPILINILLILKNKQNNVICALLLFVTFMIKQNIFIYFATGIFIYYFIIKNSIKEFIINVIQVYGIALIGIIIFVFFLYLDNNLYNFINYCFLGISEFHLQNKGIEIAGARYAYISIGIAIVNLVIINVPKIKKNLENDIVLKLKVLLSFGIPLLLIQYPIANYYHSTLASLIVLISFIYFIDTVLIKNLEINEKKEKTLYIMVTIIYLLYYVYIISNTVNIIFNEKVVIETEGAYSGSLIPKEELEDIEIIARYIKEQEKNKKNVIILSHRANLYNINLNRNNGIFDLYFLGNLGKGGEKELIMKIDQLENTIIFTEKDNKDFIGQEAINARNYVLDNWNKVGEIQDYYIYEHNKGAVRNNIL